MSNYMVEDLTPYRSKTGVSSNRAILEALLTVVHSAYAGIENAVTGS